MEKTARFLSILLHPLFIPPAMAVFVFMMPVYPFSFYTDKAMFIVVALTLVFNVIMPLMLIFLMKKSGLISSLFLDNRRDRILPLFVYALLLYLNAIICKKWELPALWEVTVLLTAMLSLTTIFISLFMKISFHMVGWGGFAGLLIVLIHSFSAQYFIALSFALLLSGISGWGRSVIKAHKAGELITGFVVGCLCVAGGLLIILSANRA